MPKRLMMSVNRTALLSNTKSSVSDEKYGSPILDEAFLPLGRTAHGDENHRVEISFKNINRLSGARPMPPKIIKTISAGSGIQANVMMQHHKGFQPTFSVSLVSETSKSRKIQEPHIYLRDDLPKLEHVIRKAFDYIITQQTISLEETLNSHVSKLAQEKQTEISWSKV